MRYHYISVRISKIKKKNKTDNVNCIEQQSHLFIAGENKSQAQALWKATCQFLKKAKLILPLLSSFCVPSYLLK